MIIEKFLETSDTTAALRSTLARTDTEYQLAWADRLQIAIIKGGKYDGNDILHLSDGGTETSFSLYYHSIQEKRDGHVLDFSQASVELDGKVLYLKMVDGSECIYTYDTDGNTATIVKTSPNGEKFTTTYSKHGHDVHHVKADGTLEICKFDTEGHVWYRSDGNIVQVRRQNRDLVQQDRHRHQGSRCVGRLYRMVRESSCNKAHHTVQRVALLVRHSRKHSALHCAGLVQGAAFGRMVRLRFRRQYGSLPVQRRRRGMVRCRRKPHSYEKAVAAAQKRLPS